MSKIEILLKVACWLYGTR